MEQTVNALSKVLVTSQKGTFTVSDVPAGGSAVTKTVSFSQAFSAIPTVLVSAYGNSVASTAQASVIAGSITKGGFQVKIQNYWSSNQAVTVEWNATAPKAI